MSRHLFKAVLASLSGGGLAGVLAGLTSLTIVHWGNFERVIVPWLLVGSGMMAVLGITAFLVRLVLGNRRLGRGSGWVLGSVVSSWLFVFWLMQMGADPRQVAFGIVFGALALNWLAFRGVSSKLTVHHEQLLERSLKLAQDQAQAGNLAQASLTLTEAFQVAERTLGGRHPIALETVLRLAEIRLDADKPQQASALLASSGGVIKTVFGEDGEPTGRWWLLQGRAQKDLSALEKSIEIFKDRGLRRSQAEALQVAGEHLLEDDPSKAEDYFQRALELLDPVPAAVYLGLGRAQVIQDRPEEALKTFRRGLKGTGLTDKVKVRLLVELSHLTEDPVVELRQAMKLLTFEDVFFEEVQLRLAQALGGEDYSQLIQAVIEGQSYPRINATAATALAVAPEIPPEEWLAPLEHGLFTPLQWAAWKGRETWVRRLLEWGSPLGGNVVPPAHLAALKGEREILKLLVEAGAELEETDEVHQRTPFFMGVVGQSLPTVELLADLGATLDPEDHLRQRPIHYAAFYGNETMISQLARLGADLDGVDEESGQTALHVAVAVGKPGPVRALLEGGADPDLKEKQAGWTPLELARASGRTELVDIFEESV